jgi:hypothetical protein
MVVTEEDRKPSEPFDYLGFAANMIGQYLEAA